MSELTSRFFLYSNGHDLIPVKITYKDDRYADAEIPDIGTGKLVQSLKFLALKNLSAHSSDIKMKEISENRFWLACSFRGVAPPENGKKFFVIHPLQSASPAPASESHPQASGPYQPPQPHLSNHH